MVATLDELALTDLVCSIDGLSAVGAAAILAETGDLRRFTSARAVVKHAGLAPRERMSGTFTGKARLTGAGRPGLRVAAWRAMWGAMNNNEVYAERYRHLTTREVNKLKPTPGADRDRGSDPQAAPRSGHHRPRVEPDHRCRRPRQGRARFQPPEGIHRARTRHKAESGRAFCGIENPRVSRR